MSTTTMASTQEPYSSIAETSRIFDLILSLVDPVSLPPGTKVKRADVDFTGARDQPYFFIPFKETETAAALKAVEGCVASLLADLKIGGDGRPRRITVDQEKTTAFLFQAYLARVGGLGKLDKDVRSLLKGEPFIQRIHPRSRALLLLTSIVRRTRHGSAAGAVGPVPPHVGQPVRDGGKGRVLPHPRISRGVYDAAHDWARVTPPGSQDARGHCRRHRAGRPTVHR